MKFKYIVKPNSEADREHLALPYMRRVIWSEDCLKELFLKMLAHFNHFTITNGIIDQLEYPERSDEIIQLPSTQSLEYSIRIRDRNSGKRYWTIIIKQLRDDGDGENSIFEIRFNGSKEHHRILFFGLSFVDDAVILTYGFKKMADRSIVDQTTLLKKESNAIRRSILNDTTLKDWIGN